MSEDLQRWMNRGVLYDAPAVPGMRSERADVQVAPRSQIVGVAPGVGELAAAEVAILSGGQVQVTPAMMEAAISHQ